MEKINFVNIVMLEHAGVEGLKEFYINIFNQLGYQANINVIAGKENSKYDGNKSIFSEEVVDVFICDLSLGDEDADNWEGLSIIQKVKRDYPDLLTIANSRTNISYAVTARKIPSFDLFVHKSKIYDKKYAAFILEKIKTLFKRNIALNVDFGKSTISSAFSSAKNRLEIVNMLRTITFTAHSSDISTAVSDVYLLPLEGGMSKSETYRLYSLAANGLQCVNAALKISPREAAIREIENYNNYVKWYLPYTWRAELLGSALTKNYGAICYSFAYNDDVPFNSLTYHIKNKNDEKILYAIENIFKPSYQRWYHRENVKDANGITGHYHSKWFAERADPEPQFRKILKEYDLSRSDVVVIDGMRYPMPGGYLLGISRNKFKTCICHGDLNSNNILISDNDYLIFIDFQDTGRGHVFEDFVVFETSIRLHYKTDIPFLELLHCEYSLIKENGSCDFPCKELILKIRQYAFKNFDDNVLNYYYSLALNTYRLLKNENHERWQQEQLTACLLASIRHLSESRYV